MVLLNVAPSSGAVRHVQSPGAPRAAGVVSTGRPGELRVLYLPPTAHSGSKIVKYAATCKAKGQKPRSAADTKAPFTPITVPGMVNGLTYGCTVRATNLAGYSPKSAALSARVGAPSAPGSVVVTKETPTGSVAVFVGAASTSARAPITKYLGACTSPGTPAKPFTMGANARRVTVRGLEAGKAYLCKAKAANKFGSGPYRTQATCAGGNAKVNLDRAESATLLQSGRAVTVCATGFRAGARVSLTLHSTPVDVGSIMANSNGMIQGSVSIPSTVPDGSHTLIATGASENGTLTESAPVTVKYDLQPPVLTAFALSATSIDTSAASQTITVTSSITDDLSGNGPGSHALFESPSGQSRLAYLSADRLISGTPQDGVVSFAMAVPRYSERGIWTVSVYLTDKVGNSLVMDAATMAADGFASGFEETGAGDTEPPKLTAFSVSPSTINTGAFAQTVTVTASITDDLSGNGGSWVQFGGPAGQHVNAYLDHVVSGTPQDGVVSYAMMLPRFSATGTWTASIIALSDQAGNRVTLDAGQIAALGFAPSFQQAGVGDTTPPKLTAFSISPSSIDTSSSDQTVTVTASITDDVTGNNFSYVSFRSPSGEYVTAMIGDGYRISGTPQDSVVSYPMIVPVGSQPGTWTAQYLELEDGVGNSSTINTTAGIAALGFPTTFTNGI